MCIATFKNDEIKNINIKLMIESFHCSSTLITTFITISHHLLTVTKEYVV